MLLTKEVEVKLNPKNMKHYKELGHIGNKGDIIIVPVEHLMHGSKVKVEVLCDYCKKEIITMTYDRYTRSQKKICKNACLKCKSKKTTESNLQVYGVENVFQLQEIKEKSALTCLEKYGENNYSKTDVCRKQVTETNLKCLGVDSPLRNKEIMQRLKNTNLQRYGVENVSETAFVKERVKRTNLERYGVECVLQSEEIKQKIACTNLKKYGVYNVSQSSEIKKKISESFYKNGTVKTSKQQKYLCNLYFGNLNYVVGYYNVDIALPEKKWCIEYDGSGHSICVEYGTFTQEEFEQKEIIRNNVIKREGYKQIRIISSKDLLPSDEILLQMLEHAKKYFSDYPNHSWIEFNIDTSTVRNAEQKEGVFFNFGDLRRIKKSDLPTEVADEENCA